MSKQIIGWALVLVGFGIIIGGVWSSYNIFSGKKPAPAIFSSPALQSETGEKPPIVDSKNMTSEQIQKQIQEQIQQQMQKNVQEQFGKLLPPDFIPKALNLFSWSLFTGILILAGGKIASIGTGLLKSEKSGNLS